MFTAKQARALGEAFHIQGLGAGEAADVAKQMARTLGWSSKEKLPETEARHGYTKAIRSSAEEQER